MADTNAPRIAIATCAAVAGTEPEDLAVIAALARLGLSARPAVWDDPAVAWADFDLVVVRSTWDYPERLSAFLAWAEGVPAILNPLPILRWNTDKRYLDDLARAGLPVIATRFLQPGDAFEPPPGPFVVKPAVSCGAKNTARYDGPSPAARDHAARLLAAGRTVMVQPYLPRVEAEGEVAVIYLGGVYSHAIRRGALLSRPGLRSDQDAPLLDVRPHQPSPAERALADRVMANLPGGPAGVLYARVDLIPGLDGQPVVLEVELTEPTLFLAHTPAGPARLAEAIAQANPRPGQAV